MEKYYYVLFVLISSVAAPAPSTTKEYRTDYVYNRKTDAFYKLHTESRRGWEVKSLCEVEGATLMLPSSHQDIVQLHGMFKRFPDLGDYVWVGLDGQNHESAEEQPIIDLTPTSQSAEQPWNSQCDVVTRKGDVETYPCYRQLPFMCKVDAKDAPFDAHCGVYGRGYQYVASVSSCYKIPRVVYSWNQAYAECKAEGAHLLILNSEAEMLVVKNFTNTVPKVLGAKTSWFFYAGFRAEKAVGNATRVFKTVFNQTLEEAGYNEWSANEPNNWLGNEDCGTVFKNDGKLNDVDCSHEYAFICEKEV